MPDLLPPAQQSSSEPPIASAGASFPRSSAPSSGGGGAYHDHHHQSSAGGSSGSSSPLVAPLVSVKLLVSNNVAGSIIGRSGQTISELQARSSARIKLSQAGDCYPGTSDRVCLVQGVPEGVKSAIGLVLRKLHELQRPPTQAAAAAQGGGVGGHGQQYQHLHAPQAASAAEQQQQMRHVGGLLPGLVHSGSHPHLASVGGAVDAHGVAAGALPVAVAPPSAFAFVVRLLVPTPSCGMIIGRGGANVKSMAEASGVTSIRLSPKENEAVLAATSERVVTVTGPTLSSVIRCAGLILDGMASHPEICRYANMTTSYSRASSVLSAAQQAAATAALASQSSLGAPPPSLSVVHQGAYGAASAAIGAGPVVIPQSAAPSPQRQRLDHSSRSSSSSLPPHGVGAAAPQQQQHMGTHLLGLSSSSAGGSGSHAQMRYAPVGRPPSDQGVGALPPPPPPPSPIMAPMALPSAPGGGQAMYGQHQYLAPSAAAASSSSQQQSQQSIYVLAPSSAPSAAAQIQHGGRGGVGSHSAGTSRRSSANSPVGGLTSATEQLAAMHLSSASSSSEQDVHHRHQHGYSSQHQQHSLPAAHGQHAPPSASHTVQIAVPDTLIGAILGRDGQTLKELQMSTGTRIKISQRGVFVPGTNHRVVTVSGPSAESVSTAQFMIGQRLAMRPRTDLR